MKDYRAALNHVFTLEAIDLTADRVIHRMYGSIEKNCLPGEIKSPEWNRYLIMRSLTFMPYEPLKLSLDKLPNLETLVSVSPRFTQRVGSIVSSVLYQISLL